MRLLDGMLMTTAPDVKFARTRVCGHRCGVGAYTGALLAWYHASRDELIRRILAQREALAEQAALLARQQQLAA